MYKYILKQLKRGVVMNVLFCLLLALAGTLFSLGAGLLTSALNSVKETDEMFTTIALPDAAKIRRYALNQVAELNEYETDDDVITRDHPTWGVKFDQYAADHMAEKILREIEETIYTSSLITLDTRRFYGAYSHPEFITLNKKQVSRGLDYIGSSGNAAALIVRCRKMTESYHLSTGNMSVAFDEPSLIKDVSFSFSVEEVISLHPRTDHKELRDPKRIYLDFAQYPDGSYFFKEGERYLLTGYYTTYYGMPGMYVIPGEVQYIAVDTVNTIEELDAYKAYDNSLFSSWWSLTREQVLAWDGFFPIELEALTIVEEHQFQKFFALGDMSYEEALNSEQGEAIKRAVELVEKENRRLNILTTDNLRSYYHFNQYFANLIDGRYFTKEEVENGAKVCIIPQVLAQLNGLEIGDIIQLTMFPNYIYSYLYDYDDSPYLSYRDYWVQSYLEELPESEPMEFEIAGIYYSLNTPNERDAHAIPLNTVFIPSAASAEGFPDHDYWSGDFDSYHDAYHPLMNTIIVPNGKNDEFHEAINTIIPGYSNFFTLYDQGYSIIKKAVDNLARNGTLIMILCSAGWLITLVVFCLFFVLRKKKDAGLLYALGVKRKDCFRWVFAHCAAVILVAQLAVFGVSFVLHEASLKYAYEVAESGAAEQLKDDVFSDAYGTVGGIKSDFEIARNPLVVVASAGAQTLILLTVAGGMSSALVNNGKKALRGIDL